MVVRSHVVHLGRRGANPISPDRAAFHEELAAVVADTELQPSEPADLAEPLSFDELFEQRESIIDLLRPRQDLPAEAITVVDLSDSTYDLLSGHFLRSLAHGLTQLYKSPDQTVILLLPRVPRKSMTKMWVDLGAKSQEGSLYVADVEGGVFDRYGDEMYEDNATGLAAVINENSDLLRGSAKERFRRLLLQRVGHFTLKHTGEYEMCTRLYYDGSNCIEDLAAVIVEWLRQRFTGKELSSAVLVGHAPDSDWMKEAVNIAGTRLEVRDTVLFHDHIATRKGREKPADLSDQMNIVLLDAVVTGGTMRKLVETMTEQWQVPIAPAGLVAIAGQSRVSHRSPKITFDVVKQVRQQQLKRDDCPRCRVSAAKNSLHLKEPYLRIPTDDMWEMLLDVPWGPEEYGAGKESRYEYIPNFSEAFKKYGGWIAYMYETLMKDRAFGNEVVIICPDEPGMRELVNSLSARFEERAVAVLVPREDIEKAQKGELADNPDDDASDWEEQLDYLSRESKATVVAIDEFNASGSTVEGIKALLDHFRVSLDAYLPFVDWGVKPLKGVDVFPLYAFPNPRPEG